MKRYRVVSVDKNTVEVLGNGCAIYIPIRKFIQDYGNPFVNMIIKK
jgi:hypothetical protein